MPGLVTQKVPDIALDAATETDIRVHLSFESVDRAIERFNEGFDFDDGR